MADKVIEYTITAKLWFNLDEDISINEYLDVFRQIGEAEVVDVKVVNDPNEKQKS